MDGPNYGHILLAKFYIFDQILNFIESFYINLVISVKFDRQEWTCSSILNFADTLCSTWRQKNKLNIMWWCYIEKSKRQSSPILVTERWAVSWSYHPTGSKLPLLFARPAVTSVAFTRWLQLYMVAHIQFQLTNLSTPKGSKAELTWLADL